jgi:aminopeptidase YwaD
VDPAYRVMQHLSEEIGIRFGGTEGEHRAAEWLAREFSTIGFPTELQRYGFIGWRSLRAPSVTVSSPSVRKFSAAPIIYSAATPPDGVSGVVRYHGKKELIAGLYELDCYVLLADSHPLAHLVVGPTGDAISLLNPRPIIQLPMIVIGTEDHAFLQSALGDGAEVRATAIIETELVPDAYALNVIASYRGNTNTSQRVVVIAHYDTQLTTPGCYDNASGVGSMVDLAIRVKTARLPINVDFVAVASEEIGMHGSTYLVQDLKERGELRNVAACICIDQVSAGDGVSVWAGPEDFRERVLFSVRESGLGSMAPVKVDDPMPGCDMWPFWVEGIPGCLLMWWRPPPYYHRPEDTLEKADMSKVRAATDAAFHLVKGLARSPVDAGHAAV